MATVPEPKEDKPTTTDADAEAAKVTDPGEGSDTSIQDDEAGLDLGFEQDVTPREDRAAGSPTTPTGLTDVEEEEEEGESESVQEEEEEVEPSEDSDEEGVDALTRMRSLIVAEFGPGELSQANETLVLEAMKGNRH